MVGIAVPAHVLETGGLEAAVVTVDRDLYPADKVGLHVPQKLLLMLIFPSILMASGITSASMSWSSKRLRSGLNQIAVLC